MKTNDEFHEAVLEICRQDDRYGPGAYYFVREALNFTSGMLKKPASGPNRHIRGQELLEGVRRFALQEFGPMAYTVLTRWGLQSTSDIGKIVFHLVDAQVLGKTEEDCLEDFDNGYEFQSAFAKPYAPADPAPWLAKAAQEITATQI